MRIINNLNEMTETARGWLAGGIVGFVLVSSPLHEGHRSLIDTARAVSEILVVSVLDKARLLFLDNNQKQDAQQRINDLKFLNSCMIDILFLPSIHDLFPSHFATHITPVGQQATFLKQIYGSRYVRTLTTTAIKLFHLTRPDIAFYGQSEIFQIALLRQLIHDLHCDVKLQAVPTPRDQQGIPLNDQYHFLSDLEKQAAQIIYQALISVRSLVDQGNCKVQQIQQRIMMMLTSTPLLTLKKTFFCHVDTLHPLEEIRPGSIIAINAMIGVKPLFDAFIWHIDGHWGS